MSLTNERYQYFLEKLKLQCNLAEAKLNCFITYPDDYSQILELEEEAEAIDKEISESLKAKFQRELDIETDHLEHRIFSHMNEDDVQ